jgi:phage terminase large subunit-like protein
VIGKPGDGASPSCAIVDEYHEHDTDDLYETMASGMGAREQPLIFVITTAGYNIGGPCYQMRLDVGKVLRGEDENDELFAVVYSIDEGDDWTGDLALRKANPNLGVSVNEEYLRAEQRLAVLTSRRQNTFKTKHLNIWVSARSGFFNIEAWRRCEEPGLSLAQFARERAWIGLDLAAKRDIAAAVLLFRREIDGVPHYYVFGRYYLPEAAIHEGPNARKYEDWESCGHLIATNGNVTDYDRIEDDLRDDARTFQLVDVAFDKFHATQLVGHLLDEGFPMLEVGATVLNFSEPMKELEALILDGRIHHDGNPALLWMMSNVVAKYDAKDNVFPRKERDEFKIDGPVALIMALNRAMADAGDQAEAGWFAE